MQKENLILYFVTGNKSKFNEVLKIVQIQKVKFTIQQLNIETVEIQADNIKNVALFKLNSVKDKINSVINNVKQKG